CLAVGFKRRGGDLHRGFDALGAGFKDLSDHLAVDGADMVERYGPDLGTSRDIGTNLSNRHRLLHAVSWTNDVEPFLDGLNDTECSHRRGLRVRNGRRVFEDEVGASGGTFNFNLVRVAF